MSFILQSSFAQNIENPGFELPDATKPSGLAAWETNQTFPVSLDNSHAHNGRASLRMKSVEGQSFGTFVQNMELPKGNASIRKLKLSGFLKRDSVTGFCGFWINVFAGQETIAFDNMYNQQLTGTHDWKEVSAIVYADDSATELNLGGLLVGAGTVWFDDIQITEIPLEEGAIAAKYRQYISSALKIMQKNALNRDSVDWAKVTKVAMLMAGGAKSYVDCYPAIQYAIAKLGDHHSFFMPASEAKRWENAGDAAEEMTYTTGKMLEGGIAYLSMPGVSSGDNKANVKFANKLHDLLEQLDANNPTAWVFDLRNNTGGNCWPMLAGIGPLLGEGVCGYFHTPGQTDASWFYKNGASGINQRNITKVSRKPYLLKKSMPKVAVLTGPQTGSSGEVVTVAFRGRQHCKSFGEPTYGVSTGNENFKLKDGAQLFLASSVYADRNRVAYGGKITPDVLVAPGEDDPVLQAAIRWLREQ